MRGSLVEENHEVGIGVYGSDALIEGTIVRDTQQGLTSTLGVGVSVEYIDVPGDRADATIRYSVVQRNVSSGILVAGSDATIEASVISDTRPNDEGSWGTGISIQRIFGTLISSRAAIRTSLIERTVQTGVTVAGSEATIELSHVRDVQPDAEGLYGDGVMVHSPDSPSSATLYGTRVDSSARAGVASFGAYVVLDRLAVTCGALDINGEAANAADFIFDDRGTMACGCPSATERCRVESSALEPPSVIDGF